MNTFAASACGEGAVATFISMRAPFFFHFAMWTGNDGLTCPWRRAAPHELQMTGTLG
jgi:hypothetical protein